MSRIMIQKRAFIRGKAECMACDHKFKFLLPVDVLPFWDNLCSECSMAVPDVLPERGGIVLDKWWD